VGENGSKFQDFCEKAEVSCLPATPFTVARFLAVRFKEGAQGTKG
jgi:hypothetical protein